MVATRSLTDAICLTSPGRERRGANAEVQAPEAALSLRKQPLRVAAISHLSVRWCNVLNHSFSHRAVALAFECARKMVLQWSAGRSQGVPREIREFHDALTTW